MSTEKPKQLNFNTMLLALVNMLVIVVGSFAQHTLTRLEEANAKVWQAMMPRQEIQVQLDSTKSELSQIRSDQLEFRARLSKIEIDIARLQKTP